MSNLLSSVSGLLLDIDGVFMRGSEVLPGATETIASLRARAIPFRYMTNSSIYCRHTMLDRLRAFGFDLAIDELYTATYVAARYLHEQKANSYYPLLLPDAQLEFTGIDVDEETPEYVVIGDMGDSLNIARLNRALNAVMNGAKLIALHKNRIWHTEKGVFMDAGAFVVALEYAAQVKAHVVGKPSPDYFRMALQDLDLPANRVANIGGDIEADVRGAQIVGMQGWLVKTGRFRREDLQRGIWPDRILESIQDITE